MGSSGGNPDGSVARHERRIVTPVLSPEDRRSFLYAVPYLTNALAITPLITFIPSFYSESYGLSLALVGAILFFTRLTDIVTEPVIGMLSDRTRTRFGRRKPWIVAGLPFLMLGIWMVFAPPVQVTPTYAVIWIAVTYTAYNMVETPYKAWGAELSKSYSGRTRVAGWREGFGIASSMSALALIFVLQRQGIGGTADLMFWLGTIFVVLMPILFAVGLIFVPEPEVEVVSVPPVTAREAVAVLFENKPFMRLLGGLIVLMAGAIIGASLHLIVMEKVFNAKHLFPVILAGENVAGLLSLPFWLWLSKRIGKHRALAFGTLGMALLSFPIPLIPHDRADIYAAAIVTRGFAGGALGILVHAMIADVVDLDTLRTGKARNGLYFALVGTLSKFGLALGALVGTSIPALAGFAMTGVNTDAAVFALMATYAWAPMIIMALATPFFWLYPLTEAVQRDLRAQIASRSPGGAPA
jgi:glycoside/pentoside/hexuronide:cation symporter, GPH family